MSAANLRFSDMVIGQSVSFEEMITDDVVRLFADLSGDKSPIHVDPVYAKTTPFKQPIAHGMIIGMFFSRMIGMHLPGIFALYLSQTMQFHRPIPIGSLVRVTGTIQEKSEATQTVRITLSAHNPTDLTHFVSGEGIVRLLY